MQFQTIEELRPANDLNKSISDCLVSWAVVADNCTMCCLLDWRDGLLSSLGVVWMPADIAGTSTVVASIAAYECKAN